jgi:hypothetical protein
MSTTHARPEERNVTADTPVIDVVAEQRARREAGPRLRRLGIHGPRQSGKTCYLTVLNRYRKSGDAGVLIKDDATINYLSSLWDHYLAQGRHTPRTAGIPSEIRFDLQSGGRTWEVETRDYPGERVQRPVDAETVAWLESCDAILVFVDVTCSSNDLADRLNEVDLLLDALRKLSHDGNTIARPLGLVLTKWDALGPVSPSAPAREDARAHSFLNARAEFRQLYHALLQAGHPDRVKVFPVSSFGENRGGTEPPEGGPIAPLNLHAPLVWAMRLADERLLESARRRVEERLGRWWPDVRGALAEYDRLVHEHGLNKGPLFDDEIEPTRRQLRQRLRKRRTVALALLLPVLALLGVGGLVVLDSADYNRARSVLEDPEQPPAEVTRICHDYVTNWNPMGRVLGHRAEIEARLQGSLHAREEAEFRALAELFGKQQDQTLIRERQKSAQSFRERWPGSGFLAQIDTWQAADRVALETLRHEDAYKALTARVRNLADDGREDRILDEYTRFLSDWPSGPRSTEVHEKQKAVLTARNNKAWADLVHLEERSPGQHELIINKARPFLVSSTTDIQKQAQRMITRHEADWDHDDYEAVRRACNEVREPSGLRVAQQKARDYLEAKYPPRQRKAAVEKWTRWFEGLQKSQDYYITVRSVEIPAGSKLRDVFTDEEVKVYVRIGAMLHTTGWHKGKKGSITLGDKVGPFRLIWGKEETIEVTVEEYDNLSSNDKSVGRKTDGSFVLFHANGPFSTTDVRNKDVKVYMECPEVVVPRLPAYNVK